MSYFRRLSRNKCETCQRDITHGQFGTWIDITNPEKLVSFCSYPCLEYFIDNTHKDEKIIEDLIHGIPDIEDNKNGS